MKDKTLIKITAMILIAIVEIVAIIFLDIDGVLLSFVIGVISGIAGYHVGNGKNIGDDINGKYKENNKRQTG